MDSPQPVIEPARRAPSAPSTRGFPAGPRIPPLAQSAAWVFRPVPFLQDCRRRFGETFTMRLAGLPAFVVVCDPAVIKEIFTGDPEIFHAGSANSVLKPILGRS